MILPRRGGVGKRNLGWEADINCRENLPGEVPFCLSLSHNNPTQPPPKRRLPYQKHKSILSREMLFNSFVNLALATMATAAAIADPAPQAVNETEPDLGSADSTLEKRRCGGFWNTCNTGGSGIRYLGNGDVNFFTTRCGDGHGGYKGSGIDLGRCLQNRGGNLAPGSQ